MIFSNPRLNFLLLILKKAFILKSFLLKLVMNILFVFFLM